VESQELPTDLGCIPLLHYHVHQPPRDIDHFLHRLPGDVLLYALVCQSQRASLLLRHVGRDLQAGADFAVDLHRQRDDLIGSQGLVPLRPRLLVDTACGL